LGCVAQTTQADIERIELLRGQIKSAEAQHAGAAELGGLWLRLANRHQKEQEFAPAEDSYVRALRLLRGAGAQAEYADALNGMASLELATGRLDQAKDSGKKALAVYEALGDRRHAGCVHQTIALALLFERHGREAEAESAAGLADLQAAPQPAVSDMVAARLAHSYALCFQKKCAAGLEDVDQAMEAARTKLPEESLEMVAGWLARGYDQWKMGVVEEGDRSMREALRLARGLTGMPQPMLVRTQLNVMRRYDTFLKERHRKQEAAQMEAEIGRLEAAHPAECSGCTVSVAALGFVP
jgi:tetratricopeptide (TPR) repeat protein